MRSGRSDSATELVPGVRVRVCDAVLQAFYGLYGTVLCVRCCTRDQRIRFIDVRMDDLPPGEEPATFYPDQITTVGANVRPATYEDS